MRRGVFRACEFGLLFEPFSLGPPYEEFQKMADFGVFARLASDNIVPQTAALKVPAIPSNGQSRKDTKIGHFLKFFKGGTKGKWLKK